MANEIVKGAVPPAELQKFQTACEKYGGMALVEMAEAEKVIGTAEAINAIRAALTPSIMAQVMALQGSRVGFRTDKDKNSDGSKGPGYPIEIVRDVVVEAVLYGARMTGNEVNIVANSCYLTKEHFIRKVKEIPGLTDLEMVFGVPQIGKPFDAKGNAMATVNCRARWKMNGKEMSIGWEEKDPCNISVKVWDGRGGGTDQALGKAERKLRSRIWSRATGSTITLPEGDLDERDAKEAQATVIPETPKESTKAAEVTERLQARGKTPAKASEPKKNETFPEEEFVQNGAHPQEAEGANEAPFDPDPEPPPQEEKKAPENPVAEAPKAYIRLHKLYMDHPDAVDAALKGVGLPSFKSIAWQDYTSPKAIAQMTRAGAKVAASL